MKVTRKLKGRDEVGFGGAPPAGSRSRAFELVVAGAELVLEVSREEEKDEDDDAMVFLVWGRDSSSSR